MTTMRVIPEGTVISAPDDIGRIEMIFPSKDDAIIFFEWLRQITGLVKVADREDEPSSK